MIEYHMNLLKNLCNPIQVYINIYLNKYTYKNIILFIVKSSFRIHNYIIMLNLAHLIIEPILYA